MMTRKQIIQCALCFSALLSAMQAFAISRSGNGGGGFCYDNGKCVTLAEAGLRIPLEIPLFMISQETESEVKRILSFLPLSASSVQERTKIAVGERDTFVPVQKQSERKFRDIVDRYKEMIKTYAPNLPLDRFELFAVSDQNAPKTYLLPAFFDLNPTRQALVLIHEANVRGFSSAAVPYAIQYDGILYDYFTKSEKADSLTFSLIDYNRWVAQGGRDSLSSFQLFETLNSYFAAKIGRRMRVSDYCDESLMVKSTCFVSREKAFSGSRNIDPRFAQILYGAHIYVLTGLPFGVEGQYDLTPPASKYGLTNEVCKGVASGDQVLDYVTFKDGSGSHLVIISCTERVGQIVPSVVQFFDPSDTGGFRTQ